MWTHFSVYVHKYKTFVHPPPNIFIYNLHQSGYIGPPPHLYSSHNRQNSFGCDRKHCRKCKCFAENVALIPFAQAKLDHLSEHYEFDDVDLEIENWETLTHTEYKKTCCWLYFWLCCKRGLWWTNMVSRVIKRIFLP